MEMNDGVEGKLHEFLPLSGQLNAASALPQIITGQEVGWILEPIWTMR